LPGSLHKSLTIDVTLGNVIIVNETVQKRIIKEQKKDQGPKKGSKKGEDQNRIRINKGSYINPSVKEPLGRRKISRERLDLSF